MARLRGGIKGDADGRPAAVEGDQVIEAGLYFGEGDSPAPAVVVRVTWNRGYRTPVVAVHAPHPGIRLDVYSYKGIKIFSTLPKGGVESDGGDAGEV